MITEYRYSKNSFMEESEWGKISQLKLIVVLGATMKKNLKTNRWEFPVVIKSDPAKIVGGEIRALATRQLVDRGFRGDFAITGGYQVDEMGKEESKALHFASLMVERYRIPSDRIDVIGKKGHGNTLGNVVDAVDNLQKYPNIREIGILSNWWHLERAILMFYSNPYIHDNINVIPINADDVVSAISASHAEFVASYNRLPQMQTRLKMEKCGIKAFIEGRYRSKSC